MTVEKSADKVTECVLANLITFTDIENYINLLGFEIVSAERLNMLEMSYINHPG